MEDGARDDEKVGFEGTESETFECQGKVLSRSCLGDLEKKADDVEGPEIKIAHAFPEKLGCNRLAIMHATFRGIFSNHSVDDDCFLAGANIS